MKTLPCLKEFARYSSLNILGMIGISFYILADTFFIAKGMGPNGLAALNIAIPAYSFMHGCGLMLGMGGAIKFSIFKSQGHTENANMAFTHTVVFTLCFAAVFFLIGAFLSAPAASALGATGEVYEMCRLYLQVILLFSPMFMCNNIMLAFVRNDGVPQLAMIAMIVGSLSNIVLDYIFIFPLNMGIFGAVLATGFSPVISMLILSTHLLKKKNSFHFVKFKFSGLLTKHIFANGFPSLITELSAGIVIIVFNILILKHAGNVGVAAYGIIANLSLVVNAIYTGMGQGMQPIISKNYGTNQHRNVKFLLRYGMITVFCIFALVYACVFFGADGITSAFNSEGNKVLHEIAVYGLRLYFIGCLPAGLNIILSVYFTSVDNAKPAHFITMLRGFFIVIPLSFLFSWLWEMTGIWLVFPTTELIVCMIGMLLYWKSKKRKASV